MMVKNTIVFLSLAAYQCWFAVNRAVPNVWKLNPIFGSQDICKRRKISLKFSKISGGALNPVCFIRFTNLKELVFGVEVFCNYLHDL